MFIHLDSLSLHRVTNFYLNLSESKEVFPTSSKGAASLLEGKVVFYIFSVIIKNLLLFFRGRRRRKTFKVLCAPKQISLLLICFMTAPCTVRRAQPLKLYDLIFPCTQTSLIIHFLSHRASPAFLMEIFAVKICSSLY